MAAAAHNIVVPYEVAPSLVLRFPRTSRTSPDWFYEFCRANDDFRFEQTAQGDIVVVPPSGFESGDQESEAITQLRVWAKRDGSGRAFGSNTGFRLPNGATRAADAFWVRNTRLAKLSPKEKRVFPLLCPDFVIEIRSPSDRLNQLQGKMVEYIENGAKLGWLIDPEQRMVHVYRPGKAVKQLKHPKRISGSPELPGFTLKLDEIWNPGF